MSPDWPKLSMPSGTTRWPRTEPSHDSASGWPSMTVTMRASRDNGASSRSTGLGVESIRPDCAAAVALLGEPVGVQPVGRGQHQEAGAREIPHHALVRGDRLRRDRAHGDDGDVGARLGRGVPVAAGHDVGLLFDRQKSFGLRQAARRKTQIDRAALGLLHVVEAVPHQDRQLVDIGRLVGDEAGLADADQRRVDALVRAAFRCERHARRRRHDHEARILVAGVVQRIEAARDEGIVERADRQQARAEDLVAEAHGGQLDEQIVLGDAELDVLALRRLAPAAGPIRP